MVVSSTGSEKNGIHLTRFSSIEPRSPTSPNGNDHHLTYTSPDPDDNVFTDEKEVPKFDVPPTPGTVPYHDIKTGWSKRPLRCRDIVFITIGVVLLVAVAVGVALTIIFINKGSSSSSSALSTSTVQPTMLLSSSSSTSEAEPTTVAPTSSPSEEIHYDGHLNLSSPWETSMVELEHIFEQDMTVIIATSPLYKSFIKSSLLNVSDSETLIFTLDFKKRSLIEAVNITEEVTDNSLARTVQTILREQVVTNTGIKLPIKADSIVIFAENIPATTSVTTAPVSTTTETEELCISMTFEPCHSLLGSSNFYLPNILHHKLALQAEDAYQELSGPGVNTSCSDFSLLYLCALLFPSCDENSNIPLYPCDSLCEVVKNECGILSGWPQNCNDLPKVNCTVAEIKSTTKSQTMLTSTASTVTLSPTSTSLETTSSEPTVTSIQTELQCVPFNFSLCNDLGLNETVIPSYKFHCHNVQCLIEKFNEFAADSIENRCTSDLTFFCAYTFQGCNKDNMLEPIGPCFDSCNDAVDNCGNYMPQRPDCVDFLHTPCFPPEPAPLTTTQLPHSDKCVEQPYKYCASEGYLRTQAGTLDTAIKNFDEWALPTIETGCSEVARFFYCGIFLPFCDDNGNLKMPCPEYCEDVHVKCPNVTFPMDCSSLDGDDKCLRPLYNTTISTSTSTASPTTALTSTKTIPNPHCEPLKSSICSEFGYHQTSFPNLWDDASAEEANKTYYKLAERSVAAGCSPNILFYVCSALFPSCEGDGFLKLPCTTYCEEVNAQCPLLFKQNCRQLSDPRPGQCLSPPVRTACATSEFTCVNINKCVPLSAKCNKQNDCGDWSDERQCNCSTEFEVQCAMGLCIPSYYRCDDVVHCPDNSDEVGCECKNNQYKCGSNGTCIMPEWLCDGHNDCPDGDDEMYCRNCGENQFWCVDNTCIPESQLCDGISQCPDHSDELTCIFKGQSNSPFFIKSKNLAVTVCYEGFTVAHGETACLKMGEVSLKKLTALAADKLAWFFQLDPNGDLASVIGKGKSVVTCPGNLLAAVECNPKECGHPRGNLNSFIINGRNALPGTWPWMVSVRKYGIHQCGGAIIHPYFILTAAHCIESSFDYQHMVIIAGTHRLSEMGTYGQKKFIRRAITYPEYKQLEGNDIALLELKEPLTYDDFVKPLCYPEKEDVFTRANQCFVAGWGHTKGVSGETSEYQQETKMILWATEKCNSSYMWNGYMRTNDMCAGYYNGRIAACSGDSGSPVACKDETGTWKQVGVASYVYKTCSVATKPLVYTSIMPYLGWIQNHTVCQFTCGDGICLFDKGMLCNTVADCKDRSDEITQCDVRVNCSFSEKFICGYQSKWHLVVNAGSGSVNRHPLYDHTVGKYPGMYLLGRTQGDDIKTPRINLTSPHCMSFYFHFRGSITKGIDVYVHDVTNKNWINAWELIKTYRPDKWLMGMFDLGPGNYEVVFRTHETNLLSLDDIRLVEGKCNNYKCPEGEFMCPIYGLNSCLPLAVMCNIVLECDNDEDEYNCEAPAYICDFENGNICNLEQATDDTVMEEWIMVNSSNTPGNLHDHTFGNDSGIMLKLKTEALLPKDNVSMFHELRIDNIEYCLKFYYASTSPATFQVAMQIDESDPQILMKFSNRKTEGWTFTQVTLPAVGEAYAKLFYQVLGADLGDWPEEQAIILDDIGITVGQCPTFTCPSGSLLCEGESYCVPESKICDRIIDCSKSTDEISCECSATEFKCPTGPCIPKTLTCDRIQNCADGSDEAAVCDKKRSVSCDFEDAFLCGYRANLSNINYHWERASGKTGDKQTGPSYDHTYLAAGTLNGSYIVADSHNQGEYTVLESLPFISTGKGLDFYYHARHLLFSAGMTGQLTLNVTFMSNDTQIQLWSAVPDNEDTWKHACLDLPVGNISISFVAQRGTFYHADMALDDIQLLKTSCDQSLAGTRIIGGNIPSECMFFFSCPGTRIIGGNIPPTSQTAVSGCQETHKACNNGMCISANMFCDHVMDCVDNSDETNC